MVIYVSTNSVGIKTFDWGYPTFIQMLGGKIISSYHSYMPTFIASLWQINHLKLNPEDKVIFNMGINDCIYRKEQKVQLEVLENLLKESVEAKDTFAIDLLSKKINFAKTKGETDLFQLLEFKDFETIVNDVFKKVGKQGVVLSIHWFDPNSNIGWATKECIQTNTILYNKSKKYGLKYINLWTQEKLNYTYDDIHLTKEGHNRVYKMIKEVI
jgi:lysophospholipase L1-like esterase